MKTKINEDLLKAVIIFLASILFAAYFGFLVVRSIYERHKEIENYKRIYGAQQQSEGRPHGLLFFVLIYRTLRLSTCYPQGIFIIKYQSGI
jgi:ABC-type spermidine/putrescine transport system permease subunit I